MYWNGKIGSLSGGKLPKVSNVLKNALIKSCLKLNFLKKLTGRICLSPPILPLGDSKDFLFLKYDAMEWE